MIYDANIFLKPLKNTVMFFFTFFNFFELNFLFPKGKLILKLKSPLRFPGTFE